MTLSRLGKRSNSPASDRRRQEQARGSEHDEEKDGLDLEIRFVRMKCEGMSKAMGKLERGVDVALEELEAEERERESHEQGA